MFSNANTILKIVEAWSEILPHTYIGPAAQIHQKKSHSICQNV